MTLTVIEGGRSGRAGVAAPSGSPTAEDVRREAARRCAEAGINAARVRAFTTGRPVPARLHYLQMQVSFAADALCRLDSIPLDFASDRYWPRP